MYRVYLDWNVISNLKKCPNEHYVALVQLLNTYRSRLWIPYSAAHLRDLGRGYDAEDPNKVRYTYRDLGYLMGLTRGNCLVTTFEQSKPRRGWRDPFEFFESLQESQNDDSNSFEGLMSIFKDDSTPELAALGSTLTNLLETTPMPYPANAPPSLDRVFPKWQELQSFAGMMQDMYSLIDKSQRDPTYLQELRALIDDNIPNFSTSAVSSAEPANAFAHIDKLLSPMMGGKSIFAMLAANGAETSKPKTEADKLNENYLFLDMLGYRREKLSAKNHFPNIIDDMTHAYLAGHCDFFVAEDKTLRAKAAAVYAKEGVRTRICTVEQVVEELTERLSTSYTASNFFQILQEAIIEAIQPERLMPDLRSDDTQASYYYLGWLFLERFNTVRVERLGGDEGMCIQFMEFKLNYADSIMTEELSDLVALLVNCLGVDNNGQALLHRSEWDSFGEATWTGRRWSYGHISLFIRLDEMLGLVFEYTATVPPPLEESSPPAAPAGWISRLQEFFQRSKRK
jgi:hypothetical protein